MSALDKLTEAIVQRTGGKRPGEMTAEEIRVAFANGPIQFRSGEVVDQ